MKHRFLLFLSLLLYLLTLSTIAQTDTILYAPCGVVDAIEYPIENLAETTIARGFDDFALFRTRFGGNHLGLDIAFRQQGNPVRAIARGRVTLADITEWDTEKGVIILEHVFPDGEVYYSLYGHIELYGLQVFPSAGTCVELGDILAAVGDPSMSAPHLHLEIRTLLPAEGGPGYTDGNPLEEGWLHPLDFIHLWQARLNPAHVSDNSYLQVPDTSPVTQANGTIVISHEDTLIGLTADNAELWRVTTTGTVDLLESLSDNRVFARTRDGQMILLTDGRYTAVWTLPDVDTPYALLGEMVIFARDNGDVEAYSLEGQLLWNIAGEGGRILQLTNNASQVMLVRRTTDEDSTQRLLVDTLGTIIATHTSSTTPLIAPARDNSWRIVADGRLWHQRDDLLQELTGLNLSPGRTATLQVDRAGNSYLYADDSQSNLVSWSTDGTLRWRVEYPSGNQTLFAPLMTTDDGCLLYTLDLDGHLNQFNASTGELIDQIILYAGGTQTRRPSARSLGINADLLRVHTGFLTTITLNSRIWGASILETCLLG